MLPANPIRILLALLLAFLLATPATTQAPDPAPTPEAPLVPRHVLAAADMRESQDLSGPWHWSIDPYRDGLAGFHGAPAGEGSRRWFDRDIATV
jgi:beta-glucuronidase